MHKITTYLLPLLVMICSSLLGQNCKSLTWHTPNVYAEDITEANPLKLADDSLRVVLNYDCSTTLSPKDFSIWIDGIEEENDRARIKQVQGRSFTTIIYTRQGKHKIEVKAGGAISSAIWLSYAGKPDLYVFSVGVPHPDLAYTATDAKDIENAFKQLEGRNIFGNIFSTLQNTETNTSKSDIRGGLRKLYALSQHRYIRKWDFVVIYLASHGFTRNDTFYFQCKGFIDDPLLYSDYTISSYELLDLLQKIPCKKLLLIDACYSGALKQEVAFRGEDYEYQNALAKLANKANALSILTATDKEQTAAESDKWQNGAFTEALLEALVQGKCDKNQDAILDLKEIADYVKNRVPELVKQVSSHKTQTPTLVQDSLGGDMPIFATRTLQNYEKLSERQEIEYDFQQANLAYKANNFSLAFDLFYKHKDSPYFGAEEQTSLGRCYIAKGMYEEGIKWYQKAIAQGNARAQNNLGACYFSGQGVSQDYYKAVEWYQKAANQGLAIAQNNLARCYNNGQGVIQDYEKAVEWYEKAANQGDAKAQYNLGNMYYYGQSTKQDYYKAFEWYEKAANQGDALAQCNLGVCYYEGEGVSQNYPKAVEWYEKAANQGDAMAQNNLALCYYKGLGVIKNYKKSFEWYEKAANQGRLLAQYNLAYMYENGQGVKQDYDKAVEWYEKAANQGDAMAQYNLGYIYEKGQGVKQDYDKAFKWYEKALNSGKIDALIGMGLCYAIKQNYNKAFDCWEKAANQGIVAAQYNLGVCYLKGEGVKQDYDKGIEWLQKAARREYEEAQLSLKKLGKTW